MFISCLSGLSLFFSLKAGLRKLTLVFLRARVLVLIIGAFPFFTVSANQDVTKESIATAHSVQVLIPNIVVNSQLDVHNISLKKLRAIFAMKLRFWSEDQSITVFVLPKDNPVHAAFCKKILNIFPNQLESIWFRQVYTGTGQAPIEVASEAELLQRVKMTPGSIGYIYNKNEDLKRFSDEIKILKVN